jgi:hypothetical protein
LCCTDFRRVCVHPWLQTGTPCHPSGNSGTVKPPAGVFDSLVEEALSECGRIIALTRIFIEEGIEDDFLVTIAIVGSAAIVAAAGLTSSILYRELEKLLHLCAKTRQIRIGWCLDHCLDHIVSLCHAESNVDRVAVFAPSLDFEPCPHRPFLTGGGPPLPTLGMPFSIFERDNGSYLLTNEILWLPSEYLHDGACGRFYDALAARYDGQFSHGMSSIPVVIAKTFFTAERMAASIQRRCLRS